MIILTHEGQAFGLDFNHVRGDLAYQRLDMMAAEGFQTEDEELQQQFSDELMAELAIILPEFGVKNADQLPAKTYTTCDVYLLPATIYHAHMDRLDAADKVVTHQLTATVEEDAVYKELRTNSDLASEVLTNYLKTQQADFLPLGHGEAWVNPKDNFSAGVGRKISLTKALVNQPKPFRQMIWAGYRNEVRTPFPKCKWSWSNKVQRHAREEFYTSQYQKMKDDFRKAFSKKAPELVPN
jgi:hypothetical protein